MDLISFVLGLAAGILIFLLAYILIKRTGKSKPDQTQPDLRLRVRDLEMEIFRIQTQKNNFEEETIRQEKKIEGINRENLELHKDLVSKNENLLFLKEKLGKQTEEFDKTRKTLQIEFKNLANDILDEKTRKFTEQNSVRLNEILVPFKDQISGFEKRVEDTYQKSLKDQTDLQAELKKLQDLNVKISEEANNLTRALKGDVKKQGNWGEMILERILERSGLNKDEEYTTQESLLTDDGRRIQPDVIIHLPDNKHILVDSKVSLIAYNQYLSTEDTEEQKTHIKEHLGSIKRHVKELSEKNYQNAKGIQSPDFVLLFMPMEASFSIAVKEDPGLFNEAWERHIVIVSPTTLLATLMTIASIWKQENQTKHAVKIAEEGAKLYDKFVSFLDDLDKLGERLDGARRMYDDSMKKLKTGRGNLISKVENLKKMGVRSKSGNKKLPASFEDYESED
ncbi:MAG: DNA recombination protein RmuC [Bacteroidetes bacterium]|jgi:DNA recombination protein RmuC|nr:DNA recombination protein RmuC [Bacteroidota bacterium]MBT3751615.1 DNA recombination protein RmuC [Bacteroidota bacterium]MBT4400108.1 DNA recombination protein RmuC [Bacteroidota bacterium]MBT4411417.1 DNA recombination protein RmuC [Bacteroidota bacterium]MBT5425950.1 DNA recombination protein RmuC [Bacteroidota bacterium]